MIYTVTLNPAVDYFIHVDKLQLGHVNRSTYENKAPGGKGINVSRVLKRLGHQSQALGFIGGFTGEYVKNTIEAEGILTRFIQVKGDTRINVKMKSEDETEINGSSPSIQEQDIQTLTAQINQLSADDILVLAGSVPNSLKEDIYNEWIVDVKARGAEVFIDTSGLPLKKAIDVKPTFIKPNQHELEELFQVSFEKPEDAIPHVQQLVDLGIEYVLVSFAGAGAILGTKEALLFANTPKGVVRNSVGAGDSTVAGFITAKLEGLSLEESFKFAVATGSATAFSSEFCRREEVLALTKEIEITTLRKGD
ncbi:1-phosphofructokinase [Halalkalibacter urbisdiaboli]|uniref:1-phosphofructokinase n=1 Tax=Halalkalibacter urbisdiaboli TaxID=1960589 RepID=UPI000B43E765|nr:1-phosphofructokinase [Halalkalibacter urbisdiaboli]